jgi:hypothetical protein
LPNSTAALMKFCGGVLITSVTSVYTWSGIARPEIAPIGFVNVRLADTDMRDPVMTTAAMTGVAELESSAKVSAASAGVPEMPTSVVAIIMLISNLCPGIGWSPIDLRPAPESSRHCGAGYRRASSESRMLPAGVAASCGDERFLGRDRIAGGCVRPPIPGGEMRRDPALSAPCNIEQCRRQARGLR